MWSSALVAALVGYSASVAILLQAARALGATEAQTASWLLAICLAKAAGTVILSRQARIPMILAWSTPGAALIAATAGVSLAEAVAAFMLAGALTALTGVIRPLGALMARIPDAVAGGMLAGVLLPFVLAGLAAVTPAPALVLPMVAAFLFVRRWRPAFAVLAALILGVSLAFGSGAAGPLPDGLVLPRPVWVTPAVDATVLLGLGLPLYLVTMASQNLPGFATIRAAGYTPPVSAGLVVTGAASVLSAPFGAHPVSMAAITAAIVLGPETDPDPATRWRVAYPYAAAWLLLGLFSPAILSLLAALPPEVMAMLVALALTAPLAGALGTGFAATEGRFAATVTLAVTASGIAAFGIGAAFWGLLAGLAITLFERRA